MMASLFDKLSSVSDFDRVFGNGVNSAGYGTFEASAQTAKTYDDEVRERLARMRQERAGLGATPSTSTPASLTSTAAEAPKPAGVMSRVGGALRGVARIGFGPIAAGLALLSPSEAGAGSDVITNATTGRRIGGPRDPADEAAFARLDELNARGLQRAEERTASVNDAIARSQALAPAANATAGAGAVQRATPPRITNFRNLGSFLSNLLEYGNQRGIERQREQQEFQGGLELQKLRETLTGKILEKRAGLEQKVIPVEGLQGKGAVYGNRFYSIDPKTNKLKIESTDKPSVEQAHAEARAALTAKRGTKAQINQRLKELGYPEID